MGRRGRSFLVPGTGVRQLGDEHGEEDGEDAGHCVHALAASASAWCSRMRHDGPLMLKTTALCIRRSKMALATTASPNTSPQEGRPRLVVTRVG